MRKYLFDQDGVFVVSGETEKDVVSLLQTISKNRTYGVEWRRRAQRILNSGLENCGVSLIDSNNLPVAKLKMMDNGKK